jgi:hypothetical protein
LLSGCAAEAVRTETVTVNVPVYVALPQELTEPVPEPDVQVKVWDDVVQLAEELRAALRQANDKLAAIRKEQP